MITVESKLEILAAAQRLFFFEKNWSKEHGATRAGDVCPPWDLQADAWNSFGAIERILINQNEYRLLFLIISEIEKDSREPLLVFDKTHSHLEIIDLFYTTMQRLCNEINWSMMTPLFPITSEDIDFNVMFMSNKDLDEMDLLDEEYRKEKEVLRRQDDWMYGDDRY